jgi:hypothetical protein
LFQFPTIRFLAIPDNKKTEQPTERRLQMILYNIGRTMVMMIGGAVAGLLYVLLLPFLWIGAAAVVLAKRSFEMLMNLAAKSTGFGWRPVESYLTGKDKKKKNRGNEGKSKET